MLTPIVVHADHNSLRGYCSRANSAIFCVALRMSASRSLAMPCTFFRHAMSTTIFCVKGA